MAQAINSAASIDTTDLVKFAKLMAQAAEPNLDREFNKALRAAALPVAEVAKQLASWSSRIPATIKIAGGARWIVIKAGGKGAPHAAAFEHKGKPGTFRHPMFGNRDVWVAQKARPFLVPALVANHENIRRDAEAAVILVLREAGFH